MAKVEAECHRNVEQACHRRSAIIETAERLGLYPQPADHSPTAWFAICPTGNHNLMIGSDSNTFGCGWC